MGSPHRDPLLFRVLLRAYPDRLRRQLGADMSATFRSNHREAQRAGVRARVELWLQEIRAALTSGLLARLSGRPARRPPRKEGSSRPTPARSFIDSLRGDIVQALRQFARAPGFAVTVVVTLALGIGASVAIFSVVHAVLVRPLPYRDPGRVVHIFNRAKDAPRQRVAPSDLPVYRAQSELLEGIGGVLFDPSEGALTAGDETFPIRKQTVTANLFELLGFEPELGRSWVPEEDFPTLQNPRPQPGVDPPFAYGVIISDALWRRVFGADPEILGRTIHIPRPARVVGVMPAGFTIYPDSERADQPRADLWEPAWALDRIGVPAMTMFGRMKPGVTVAQVQAEMDAVSVRLQREVPRYEAVDLQTGVVSARQDVTESVRPALLMLTGAVGFLLLLSCANVASLELVRLRARAAELSVRAALGCGRHRLFRQSITESLMLASVGGLAGVGLAWICVRTLLSLRPANLPRFDDVAIDGAVLGFSLAASLLAAFLFGLLPAVAAGRTSVVEALGAHATVGGGRQGRFLGSLAVAAIAMSIVLLFGAGLMVRTFVQLRGIDVGFDPEGAMTFRLPIGTENRDRIFDVEDELRALPGVTAVGSSNGGFPLTSRSVPGIGVTYAREEESEAAAQRLAVFRAVSGDYFQAMGTRLLAGRHFSRAELRGPRDRGPSAIPIIIDTRVAREAWPGGQALGESLVLNLLEPREATVVGIVEEIHHGRLTGNDSGAIFFPYSRGGGPTWYFVVRAQGDLDALVGPIRERIRALDPGLPMYQVGSLAANVGEALAPTRFLLTTMAVFAGVALTLAAGGLFGLLAYAVRQRTAEIGVRLALGADKSRVLRLVVGRGVALAAIGVGLGVAGAIGLSRSIESLVYGVSPTDPGTLIVVSLLALGVSLLASYLPARRATRIEPALSLRARS